MISEQKLLNGIGQIEKALDNGKAFIHKQDANKLAILFNGLLYVICLDSNPNEITFLNTLFKPTQKYIKQLSKKHIKTQNPQTKKNQ